MFGLLKKFLKRIEKAFEKLKRKILNFDDFLEIKLKWFLDWKFEIKLL
jgi:hypothetical protein